MKFRKTVATIRPVRISVPAADPPMVKLKITMADGEETEATMTFGDKLDVQYDVELGKINTKTKTAQAWLTLLDLLAFKEVDDEEHDRTR